MSPRDLAAALALAGLGLALATSASCAQILGGDADYHLTTGGDGGAAGTGGGDGGQGGTGATGGTGGTGMGGTGMGGTGMGGTGMGGTGGTTLPCGDVDLQTSSEHCGECGHDCLGGACEGGACQPVVLAQDLQGLQDMALDATHVYWLTIGDGRIERMQKDGSAREIVVEGRPGGRSLLVDADHVYWTDVANKRIDRAEKKANAETKNFSANITAAGALARTNQAVLVTEGAPEGAVTRLPLAGGPKVQIAAGLVSPSLLVTDDTSAYFVDVLPGAADDQLLRVPLAGGSAPTPLAGGLTTPRALARDAVFVYFADEAGTVARVAMNGAVTPLATDADGASGIAVDAQHVHWTRIATAAAPEGSVWRAAKDGAGAVAVATGLVSPRRVLVDDDAVYWIDPGPPSGGMLTQGKIYRLAK